MWLCQSNFLMEDLLTFCAEFSGKRNGSISLIYRKPRTSSQFSLYTGSLEKPHAVATLITSSLLISIFSVTTSTLGVITSVTFFFGNESILLSIFFCSGLEGIVISTAPFKYLYG